MSLLDNPSLTTTLLGYPIMDEGVREHFARADSRIDWSIVCRWTDRAGLIFKLLGGAALVGGVITPGSIFYHPLYPWMAAIEVDIEGVAGNDGLTVGAGNIVAYRYCRMKVTFGALGTGDVELGEERIDYSGRIITVPDNTFGFGSGTSRINLPGSQCPGILIPRATLQRTLLRQPSIPVGTIFSLLGKVNSATFLGGDPETVLFMGCCSERTFSVAGNKLWSITYSLIWDKAGWNKYLIPAVPGTTNTASFQRLTSSSGDPPYALGDLTQLGFSA